MRINNGQHGEEDMQQIMWPFTNKTNQNESYFHVGNFLFVLAGSFVEELDTGTLKSAQ